MDERVDADMRAYYDAGEEHLRLGRHRLESIRTRELLLRFLPPAPAQVLDVGGGPGHHASWLADAGYDVHLVDPMPLHVEQATTLAVGRFTAALGDARALPEEDRSADAVLMLGPLYHLPARADRVKTWREAGRVVRPGGLIAAALISRPSPLVDGLARNLIADPAFGAALHGAFAAGFLERKPPIAFTAHFHEPDEAEPEVTDAGLRFEGIYGIEGPGEWLPDIETRLDDPTQREAVLEVARALEQHPATIGISPHLLAIAHRPS